MASVNCITIMDPRSAKTASVILSKHEENNNFEAVEDKNPKTESGTYDLDIYRHLRSTEARHRPEPGYMNRQPHVKEWMRADVVEFMVRLCEVKNLPTSTLYLAVAYVDRILSQHSVKLQEFELLGLVALIIASKVDLEYGTSINQFLCHVGYKYTKNHVLRIERLLLGVLNYELLVPTAYDFLEYYCTDLDNDVKFMSMYICELTLLESEPYSQFLPSHLAATAIAVAQNVLEKQVWSEELEAKSGYGLLDLHYLFHFVERTFRCPCDMGLHQGLQRKYGSEKYLKVSFVMPRKKQSYAQFL